MGHAESQTLAGLLRQWRDIVGRFESGSVSDAEGQRLAEKLREIESSIVAVPAKTAADLAVKLMVVTANGQQDLDGSASAEALLRECRQLAARV